MITASKCCHADVVAVRCGGETSARCKGCGEQTEIVEVPDPTPDGYRGVIRGLWSILWAVRNCLRGVLRAGVMVWRVVVGRVV